MDNLSFADLLIKLHNLKYFATSKFDYDLDDEHILLSQSLSNSAISGLIGKEVIAKSKSIFFDGLKKCEVYFETTETLTNLEIYLSDSKGNIVFSSKISSKLMKFVWDGIDNLGKKVSAGEYFFTIYNPENHKEIYNCVIYIIGRIKKMIFSKQGVFFNINNIIVPYDSVKEIRI
ncbi:hypothetical protein D9V86_03480 [Bacteroidetes/Chlorobi group bacterium ChocPot_Mid]|nr:MAG: hypothetical protein D9V86_03480 [Bacteroidetes/Chlorobi group bacterium ChocPot_Mid]